MNRDNPPTSQSNYPVRELESPEALDASFLAQSPDPILIIDARGRIAFASPATRELLGLDADALLDVPISQLAYRAEDLDDLDELLSPSDSPVRRRLQLRNAEGEACVVQVSAGELRGNSFGPGRMLVLHDASESAAAEANLKSKNSELEQYVQNVTHDLRSPLVSLLGFSKLLRQEYASELDDTARHFLDRIEQASRTMETLINDLLELSRIGGSYDHKSYVNVSDVLKQLQAELKPRLESQGVSLELPDEPTVVLCDSTRLYQVFSNLIGNALDYMGPCEQPCIRVEVDEVEDEHRITVSDNGRGIEHENQERIFEIFQTGGARADGRRGTGIGLAIVKKIAQSQGGRVWVESTPGRGASFHLTLPRT